MALLIDIDRDPDGSWIARVPALGDLASSGSTRAQALRAVQVEAFRLLAGQLERGERGPFAAFGVQEVEGPCILALRSTAANAVRDLQRSAVECGLEQLTEAEVEAEIQATRGAIGTPARDSDPPAVKSG